MYSNAFTDVITPVSSIHSLLNGLGMTIVLIFANFKTQVIIWNVFTETNMSVSTPRSNKLQYLTCTSS
jgi:hypothetical protein